LIATFSEQREAKRQALLDAVESLRNVFLAGSDEAEAKGTLPQATVDAIYESGLFSFKTPQVLGGAEADAMIQLDVIEAASRIESSAGWCLMIGAGSLANMAAFLCDEAIDEIFAGGKAPKTAGVAAPSGEATPVEGGYRVSGRWSFASGIRHSQWVSSGAMIVGGKADQPQHLRIVVPTSQAQIHDNWEVVGLRGTGSCEYSLSNVFVPQRFTWAGGEAGPQRGGPNFLLGRPGMQTTGHCGFALGVGRRALDAVTELAQSKKRGYRGSTELVADRGSFQRFLGESDLRLRAARNLVLETIEEAWASVCQGITPLPPLQARMRASATYSTEVAADVVSQAFRFGGGTAMFSSHVLQKCLRDINAAAQHNMVSDRAYENHGQFALGFPDANPMG
jgi:alkylation response protein AidB-like acyl-CoA dehydrogenase